MEHIFLFNQLGIAVNLNDLMKAAGIEKVSDIDSGMGYTLEKPLRIWYDVAKSLEIVDFCLTRGGSINGNLNIGANEDGKYTEYDSDWLISSESKINVLNML